MDPRPVGVFDSGMGGLTVLHECLVELPHEDFVYLGDAARLPYGPRPLPEIRRYAREIGRFLVGGETLFVNPSNCGSDAFVGVVTLGAQGAFKLDAVGNSGQDFSYAGTWTLAADGGLTLTISGTATGPGGVSMGLRFTPVTITIQ